MVYSLVLNERGGSLVQHVEVKNIGDEDVFVSNNHSVSFLASDFTAPQPKSTYFTDR